MDEEQADKEQKRLGMTDAQWETWHGRTQGFGEQDENGVDLSLLRENLKLTPTERWRRHQRALILTLEVRHAGERARLRRRLESAR